VRSRTRAGSSPPLLLTALTLGCGNAVEQAALQEKGKGSQGRRSERAASESGGRDDGSEPVASQWVAIELQQEHRQRTQSKESERKCSDKAASALSSPFPALDCTGCVRCLSRASTVLPAILSLLRSLHHSAFHQRQQQRQESRLAGGGWRASRREGTRAVGEAAAAVPLAGTLESAQRECAQQPGRSWLLLRTPHMTPLRCCCLCEGGAEQREHEQGKNNKKGEKERKRER